MDVACGNKQEQFQWDRDHENGLKIKLGRLQVDSLKKIKKIWLWVRNAALEIHLCMNGYLFWLGESLSILRFGWLEFYPANSRELLVLSWKMNKGIIKNQ